jgi:hypothetical protein
MGLKFLVENITEGLDYLVEEQNKDTAERKVYITGPFMMMEEKNQNGRVYKSDEMRREVTRYTEKMIHTKRAIGEMNHPQSTEVNPVQSCHRVVELKIVENYVMGKSQVLSTPMGQLLKSLINDGVQLGISSRALGTVTETSKGKEVSDFHLICLDVVHEPSVQKAMLESVMENREWVIGEDGIIIECASEAYITLDNNISSIPKKAADDFLREQLMSFINQIKTNLK